MSEFKTERERIDDSLRVLDDINRHAEEENERLDAELKDANKKLEEQETELDEMRLSSEAALMTLFRSPDGRRLIERAFAADPKRTGMELSYLGADDVRGELEVQAGLARRVSLPFRRPLGARASD